MKFTVVCPVHDEEDMLRRTLPSIYAIKPDEVLFCLDRCSDDSERLIRNCGKRHRDTATNILYYRAEDSEGWRFRPAYLRRDAYAHAENDLILNTSADLLLDPEIRRYLHKLRWFKLVSLGYWDYPYNIQGFIKTLISEFTPMHGYAGLVAFNREAWRECENQSEAKLIIRGEDSHLQVAIKSRHQITHVNTRTLHLRPNE